MDYLYAFEKLEVWQIARAFVKTIYQITKEFPECEKYGLISQLRRAAISVSSNIAEGNSKSSFKEKARYTEMAFSSLMEILNQLILATDLSFINYKTYIDLRQQIEKLGNKINALRNYQLDQINCYSNNRIII